MTVVKIGSVTEKISSCNPSVVFAGSSFIYVDINSVDRESKTISDPQTVLAEDAPSRARQVIKPGDVIVSTVRPNLNAVAWIPDNLDNAICSTGFCVLRPNTKSLHGRYLFHWVKTSQFVLQMTRLATGASYPAVSDKIIKESLIPLPPLPEQKRIAAILDKADEIRRKREKAIELTDSFLRSVFLEMFGDPASNPMGFKTVRFKDTVSRIFKGAFDLKAECYRALGVPFIRISNIRNGTIDLSDAVYVSDDVALTYEKASVEPGDLVFSKVGTIDRIAVVPDSLTSCIISQNNVGAKLKRDMIHPRFALAYLLHPHTLALIKRGSKKCVQDKLVLDELKDLPILLPSFDMQVKWAECVERVKALQKSLSGSMGILGELQRSLGSTFFTSNVLGGRNVEPAQEAAHAL
jgi:type I restriction enzyme S subunit